MYNIDHKTHQSPQFAINLSLSLINIMKYLQMWFVTHSLELRAKFKVGKISSDSGLGEQITPRVNEVIFCKQTSQIIGLAKRSPGHF